VQPDFQHAPALAFPGLRLRMPEDFTRLLHETPAWSG